MWQIFSGNQSEFSLLSSSYPANNDNPLGIGLLFTVDFSDDAGSLVLLLLDEFTVVLVLLLADADVTVSTIFRFTKFFIASLPLDIDPTLIFLGLANFVSVGFRLISSIVCGFAETFPPILPLPLPSSSSSRLLFAKSSISIISSLATRFVPLLLDCPWNLTCLQEGEIILLCFWFIRQ